MTPYEEHCYLHYAGSREWRKKKNAAVEAVLEVLLKHGLTAAEAGMVLDEAKRAAFNYARFDKSLITCWRDWSGGAPGQDPGPDGPAPEG